MIIQKKFLFIAIITTIFASSSLATNSTHQTNADSLTLEVMDYPPFLELKPEERTGYLSTLCQDAITILESQKFLPEAKLEILQHYPTKSVPFTLKIKQRHIPRIITFLNVLIQNSSQVVEAYCQSPTMAHVAFNVTMALGIITVIKFSGVLITLWNAICDADASARALP